MSRITGLTSADRVVAVRVSRDIAEMVGEVVMDALAEGIWDDFAKFPEPTRARWRAEAAWVYGFPTYEALRAEVFED